MNFPMNLILLVICGYLSLVLSSPYSRNRGINQKDATNQRREIPEKRSKESLKEIRRNKKNLSFVGGTRSGINQRVLTDNFTLPTATCYYPTDYGYITPDECFDEMSTLTDLPPHCISNASDLVFIDGVFSSDATFFNCLNNIPDAGSIASFYNGSYHGCWMYYSAVALLNLVEVDEVQGLSVLQVTIDLFWLDYRFSMPLFWEHTQQGYSGIDLTALLTNQSVVMWKPLLTFPDASDVNILSESFTMYDSESQIKYTFMYEATYALTLVQPGYNFRKYPNDEQTIDIRFAILNYDSEQLQLYPVGIYCSQLSDGTCSFSHNPIWTWNEDQDACTVYADKKAFSPIWPSYVEFSLSISRSGDGLVVRLVLPITFLLLLSAVTFWLSYENRVDTTITLLLSISALYIVILQNIPMVGYLTNIDEFVFVMFVLLVAVVIAHQVYGTLQEKIDKWPLRKFYMRLIEMVGRVSLPPLIVGYFFTTISFTEESIEIVLLTLVSAFTVVNFFQEVRFLYILWIKVLHELVEKINRPTITIQEISWIERMVLNYLIFKKFSTNSIYLSQLIYEKGEIKLYDSINPMELRKEFILSSMVGAPSSSKKTPTTMDDFRNNSSVDETGKNHNGGNGSWGSGNDFELSAMRQFENPVHLQTQFSQRMSEQHLRKTTVSEIDSDDEK